MPPRGGIGWPQVDPLGRTGGRGQGLIGHEVDGVAQISLPVTGHTVTAVWTAGLRRSAPTKQLNPSVAKSRRVRTGERSFPLGDAFPTTEDLDRALQVLVTVPANAPATKFLDDQKTGHNDGRFEIGRSPRAIVSPRPTLRMLGQELSHRFPLEKSRGCRVLNGERM